MRQTKGLFFSALRWDDAGTEVGAECELRRASCRLTCGGARAAGARCPVPDATVSIPRSSSRAGCLRRCATHPAPPDRPCSAGAVAHPFVRSGLCPAGPDPSSARRSRRTTPAPRTRRRRHAARPIRHPPCTRPHLAARRGVTHAAHVAVLAASHRLSIHAPQACSSHRVAEQLHSTSVRGATRASFTDTSHLGRREQPSRSRHRLQVARAPRLHHRVG
mmetsp:Transcript_43520/g.120333  ORF Transcript_43520/g.120333 Transcript_43520/m.120333 type:complete len:219 (-) Transcript_43520:40-696(-)